MTDTNPSTVSSGSSSSGRSTHSGTNTDQLGGPGSTSRPNSQRWRFDFNFNFDPSWLGGVVWASSHALPVRISQSYVIQIEPDNANGERSQEEQEQADQPLLKVGHPEQETVAPAERSDRSLSDIIRQNPEARAVINIVDRYAPLILLLLIKGLFDVGSGIICFSALLVMFSFANSVLKNEVSMQSKRNILCSIMIAVILLVCVAFVFYIFDDQKLYAMPIFMPTLRISSIWTLFLLVGVTDYVAKFTTVIIKAIVLSLPQSVTPFHKRGKYYLFVEQSSQIYRCLLPLYPWFFFFINTYDGPLQVFGFLLAGLYCAFKLDDILKRFRAWRVSVRKLLEEVHYETSPSVEEMTNAGSQCPICHDAFVYPTRLSCTHIFCEECLSTWFWFDREKTCPMCRAMVVDDRTYRDGSTTHFIQLF